MRVIEEVHEAEVIAEFLRCEIDSPRYGARIRARLADDARDAAVIERPDTTDVDANAYRAALLHGYRGVGGSAPLLEGLPERIAWTRVGLTPADLARVRYIDYPYWNELSEGTRSPLRAAERIRAGITAMGRPNDPFVAVSQRLCAGERLGLPMFVTERSGPLVIFEGHRRVTAMLLRPDCLPNEIECFVGTAADLRGWPFYGDPAGGS